MAFLEKSRTQQIQEAIKGNADLTQKANKLLRDKSIDDKFKRFLIKDQKRLNQETKNLTKMLNLNKKK